MAGRKRLSSPACSFSKHFDKEQSSELGQSWVFMVSRAFCFDLHRVSRFSSLTSSTATFSLPSFRISSKKHHKVTSPGGNQSQIPPGSSPGYGEKQPSCCWSCAEFWHKTFAQPLKLLGLRPEKQAMKKMHII